MHEQTTLSQLLDQVTAILELRKKMPPVPGENFNVFSVMHMETKEVDTHCRLLYELLSPNGSHGMGDCFLESFFKLVLQKPYPGSAAVSVYREYVIKPEDDNYGRIDLLLQGKGFCYPIEVKVYAGDQWEQVKRYAHVSSDAQVYYLTLDGHTPSEDSLGGIDVSDVVCLSFADDIRGWLKRCGELAWNVPSVAEIIRQYIKLLDKLTGNMEGDLFMEQVKDTIAMSRANFEGALAISRSIDAVKAEMMQKVFGEIERHMDSMENPLEKIDSNYNGLAEKYYQRKVYPSLSYRLATCGEYTLALRFEVDYNLFWGITFFQGDKQIQCPKDINRLESAFSSPAWKNYIAAAKPRSDWWIWWKYLPDVEAVESDREKLLNFKECSGLYTQLYDPDQHSTIMSAIFEQIDRHIGTIRLTGLFEPVKLADLVWPRVKAVYGETPPQAVTERITAELALIKEKSWEEYLLRTCEIAHRLCTAGELWELPGVDGGFLLLAFLLGITQANPLKPHYLCPKCKHFEFSDEAADGFDLPARACPHCGGAMEGDGHGLELDDCADYLAGFRCPYEPFTEWRVSLGGKAVIGEFLTQCGPVTPFFIAAFEEVPDHDTDPYDDSEGGRAKVGGWVLSPPEALPVTKWKAVEYPDGSGRFVQAFHRADELSDLTGMYRVFDSWELELLALLSRETKVPPESIPYREEGGFYAAAKTVSDRFYRPDSPGSKATGINGAIRSRRLAWFEREYPREYEKLSEDER